MARRKHIVVDDMVGEYLDVSGTSLDEWLQLLRMPPARKTFVANHFPTEAHRQEFFRRLHDLPEEDILMVLRRFLVSTGSNAQDRYDAAWVAQQLRQGILEVSNLLDHQRRLLRHFLTNFEYPVWEGLHWVLDLLPHSPHQALTALDAFFLARCQFLTDAYFDGHEAAKTIIRHRYIHSPGTVIDAKTTLINLNWRELEWMAGVLYKELGYSVDVTPRSDDDGVDVLATSSGRGEPRHIVVQTKKWTSKPVEKAGVRELLGAMDEKRATSGVLITTGRFRAGAMKMKADDPRIDLIDGDEFVRMLNEYCGTDWYLRVDRLIWEIKQAAGAKEEMCSPPVAQSKK